MDGIDNKDRGINRVPLEQNYNNNNKQKKRHKNDSSKLRSYFCRICGVK